jgi:phosphopantothenoylcysteine decarboxylase/phosphopantothenate--cysteine ligase
LKKDGISFVEPVAGELACKTVGAGKLEDVKNIVAQALNLLVHSSQSAVCSQDENQTQNTELQAQDFGLRTLDLQGEHFLITVGGTREAIDPVRFISNHSSGKMGFALAEKAQKRGAEVTIVCGVTTIEPPENIKIMHAVSAREMHEVVMNKLSESTVFIGAAAVADYRPKNIAAEKIKKNEEILMLELEKTADILADVSKNRHENLLVVGFAAETENFLENARSKMEKKNLDLIVANDVTEKDSGFNADTNTATILRRGSDEKIGFGLMSKKDLADKILDEVLKLRKTG